MSGQPGLVHRPVSAADTAAAVTARRQSAVEVTRAALARLEQVEPHLHAFLQTFPNEALAAAARVDARAAAGEHLPLAGVPIAIKDNICLGPDAGGGRTTCASRFLEHYQSPFTATAAQRLIDAGAIIIGKTNMDEFGMGSSTERSAFGPTHNPWDVARVPGGSSGGSAACVAAGIVPIALGSDTGGSIRQPAAHCGILGVKPTYGRVSRYGLVAFASSLDQIGPLTATVEDAALALEVICGHDSHDATSARRAAGPWINELKNPIAGLTVGIAREGRSSANHPAVNKAVEHAAAALQAQGVKIIGVSLPLMEEAIAAYYIIAPAEASSNLARFDGIRFGRRAALREGEGLFEMYCRSRGEGFGPEVKRRIMLGTHVLSSGYYDAYYATAVKVRARVRAGFEAAFADAANGGTTTGCDAILLPATPGPAFKLGEKTTDPLAMYLEDVYTVSINLAGLPAMVVPGGLASVDDGGAAKQLPVGVQVVGRAFDETTMLRVGKAIAAESPVSMP